MPALAILFWIRCSWSKALHWHLKRSTESIVTFYVTQCSCNGPPIAVHPWRTAKKRLFMVYCRYFVICYFVMEVEQIIFSCYWTIDLDYDNLHDNDVKKCRNKIIIFVYSLLSAELSLFANARKTSMFVKNFANQISLMHKPCNLSLDCPKWLQILKNGHNPNQKKLMMKLPMQVGDCHIRTATLT